MLWQIQQLHSLHIRICFAPAVTGFVSGAAPRAHKVEACLNENDIRNWGPQMQMVSSIIHVCIFTLLSVGIFLTKILCHISQNYLKTA